MSMIPRSLLELARQRRKMEQALASGNWREVLRIDPQLQAKIALANDDDQRDMPTLLREMEKVMATYRKVSEVFQAIRPGDTGSLH